jgi:hypothetical protein
VEARLVAFARLAQRPQGDRLPLPLHGLAFARDEQECVARDLDASQDPFQHGVPLGLVHALAAALDLLPHRGQRLRGLDARLRLGERLARYVCPRVESEQDGSLGRPPPVGAEPSGRS